MLFPNQTIVLATSSPFRLGFKKQVKHTFYVFRVLLTLCSQLLNPILNRMNLEFAGKYNIEYKLPSNLAKPHTCGRGPDLTTIAYFYTLYDNVVDLKTVCAWYVPLGAPPHRDVGELGIYRAWSGGPSWAIYFGLGKS